MNDFIDSENNILVSVIIPVYNIEKYLKRCVDSVINQTYKNLEIILIDDGSTDNSGTICDDLALNDNRIIVIHHNNQGPSIARNKGIEIAKGEYISFVDGDDYCHPKMIEILLDEVIKNGSDISVCGFKKVFKFNTVEFEKVNEINSKTYTENKILELFFKADTHYDLNVIWNKLYKAGLFSDIRFPEGRFHEDNAISYKLLDHSKSITIIFLDLYYYFQREGSTMHRNIDISRANDIVFVNEEMVKYFNVKNMYLFESKRYAFDFVTDCVVNDCFTEKKAYKILVDYGRRNLEYIVKTLTFKEVLFYISVLYFGNIYKKYRKIKNKL